MTSDLVKPAAFTCIGTEMRSGARRLHAERREMLRFEPGKDNRRSGVERRRANAIWDKQNSRD